MTTQLTKARVTVLSADLRMSVEKLRTARIIEDRDAQNMLVKIARWEDVTSSMFDLGVIFKV